MPMNFIRNFSISSFLVLFLFLMTVNTQAATPSEMSNPGFEDGLTGWTTYDTTLATGEQTVNTDEYVWTVVPAGSNMAKLQPSTEDENFADVATILELFDESISYITGIFPGITNVAYIYRDIELTKGEEFSIAWNYIATDYIPFNDASFVSLVNLDNPLAAPIVNGYTSEVGILGATVTGTGNYSTGSYGSTGWQTATFRVTSTGTYRLGFAVYNLDDTALSPILFVDDAVGWTYKDGDAFDPIPVDDDAPPPPAVKSLTYDSTDFTEAAANDGSIGNTLTITLIEDTFNGDIDGEIPDVTITNVPAGLTAVLTKTSNTVATLALTGKANAHSSSNNISNLTVVFGNGAFAGGDASIFSTATTDFITISYDDPDGPIPPSTYSITIDGGISHGVVASDKSDAEENETVTLTVTPAAGYQLVANSLEATYGAGSECALTAGAGNTYTFSMPAANVSVDADFELIPAQEPSITLQPAVSSIYTYGEVDGSLSITASVTDGGTLSYQWYKGLNSSDNTPDVSKEAGTGSNFTLPVGLAAGSHYYFCVVTNTLGSGAKQTNVSNIATVTVNKADPIYTTPTGLTATYGDALADVSLPDKFSWEDAGTTSVGNAGSNDFTVKYTPADTDNYNVVTGISVSISVDKATPTVTTPTPDAVTYDPAVTLDDISLGSDWAWNNSDIVPTVGNSGYLAIYTPSDTANYDYTGITGWDGASGKVQRTVALTVNKAMPTYATPTGLTATYGQTLANVTLPSGFTWEFVTTTSVGNAGNNAFTVKYTPTDTANYNEVTGISVTVAVGKATPSYTTPTELTATYGQTLAEVSLPSGFTWEAATTTSVGNAGNNTFTVKYTPTDTANYNEVTGISVTVAVVKANPSYTTPTGLTATYGQTLADVTLPSGFDWEVATTTVVGNAGNNAFTVKYTPTDTANYNDVAGISVTVAVGKATPSYTTPTELTATYGQTLADVSLPSGFTWEAATTTSVGNAGNNAFTVKYTPTDTDNYNEVTGISVTVAVGKANPSYTTPIGLTATYGQTLADVTLPSGFTWESATTTAVGNAGNNAFTVKYTPADTDNYNVVTGISVTVAVGKADAVISEITCADKTYNGTALAPSVDITTGTGIITYTYSGTGIDGSTLTAPSGAGTYTVTATLAASANYNAAVKTKVVTISKANQAELTITDKPASPAYEDTFTLSSSGGSGTGGLSWGATGGATVDAGSGEVTVDGMAEATITATKAGDSNYNETTDTYTFTPAKADPVIIAWPTVSVITYGKTFADAISGGSASVAGSFTISDAATVPTVSGSPYTKTITFTPDDTAKYNSLTHNVSVTVNKTTPTYATPTGLTATYGQTLADVTLPSGFTWEVAATTSVGNAGNNTFTVKYTPADTANYNEVTGISVTVAVNKADQAALTITDKPVAPVYGDTFTLSSSGGSGTGSISWGATGGATIDSASGEVTVNDMAEVTVTATKAGDSNYNETTDTYTFTPAKADPLIIAWPTVSVITYGKTFADAISGGSASVAGSFTIEDAALVPVASTTPYNKTVTFTPDDTAKYNILTNGVQVTVKSKSSPTTTTTTDTVVEVNGEKQDAGTSSTTTNNGQTVTTVTVDDNKLNTILEQKGNNATVTIPISNETDVAVGVLTGQMVKNMETKEAVLEIATGNVTYTLPASQININNVSEQIGQQVELKDIQVSITVSSPPDNTVRVVEDTANKNNYQLVVQPVQFEISCTSGDKTVSVSKFNGYVERTVAIPDGVDPAKITTGVVLNADGTFTHVPTTIILIDGKYYAKINSLTNSTYTVIYNPIEFADVANHWAKDAINDMGSRLVVTGVGNNNYDPASDITRAEFAVNRRWR